MMEFCLEHVSKVYRGRGKRATEALADVTGVLAPGEFVALVGPSGCGKSTLLRLAAGLELPSAGRLFWRGEKEFPRTAMVFQEGGLFPWLTVRENIGFSLAESGLAAKEVAARVAARMDMMGLTEFANAFPGVLSGGMKQRVGIARALVTEPDLLLMDEPFSALDAQTRWLLEEELVRYWEMLRPATLYVTHNIAEALRLADRVWVFSRRPGRVVAEKVIGIPRTERRSEAARGELAHVEREIWDLVRADVARSVAEVAAEGGAE